MQPANMQTPKQTPFPVDAQGAIILDKAARFTNAILKAREVKPLVSVVDFGHYRVGRRDENAASYDLFLWLDREAGQRKGKCSCAAGTPPVIEGRPRYAPRACYHLMAAFGRHVQLAVERGGHRQAGTITGGALQRAA